MSSPIKVTYTRTWDNKPLVQIDGGVFCDVERTPDQLRAMAAMLLKVADAGEARPTTGRHWSPLRVLLNADGEPCRGAVELMGIDQAAPLGQGWTARRVAPDLTVVHGGHSHSVAHCAGVSVNDLVWVRTPEPGRAPQLQAWHAAPPDTWASPPEPARSSLHSGPAAGTPANSGNPTTAGAPPRPGSCPGLHAAGTPQTPSGASPQARSRSHSAGTAGAAPGACPIATRVALAQRPAPAHGSPGTGTERAGCVGVSWLCSCGGGE